MILRVMFQGISASVHSCWLNAEQPPIETLPVRSSISIPRSSCALPDHFATTHRAGPKKSGEEAGDRLLIFALGLRPAIPGESPPAGWGCQNIQPVIEHRVTTLVRLPRTLRRAGVSGRRPWRRAAGAGLVLGLLASVLPAAQVRFEINDAHVKDKRVAGVRVLAAAAVGEEPVASGETDQAGVAILDLEPATYWITYLRRGYVPIRESETEIREDGQVITTTLSMLLEAESSAPGRQSAHGAQLGLGFR